jgi:uncharacterized membrane protein YedE/YeeE
MLEQLREFTAKWYGEVIPNKTDLCSFSLKTLYAVVKFGGLAALVLQPIVFGGLGWVLAATQGVTNWYLILNSVVLVFYGFFSLLCIIAYLLDVIPEFVDKLKHYIDNFRCSKTIKFTDEDD